MATETQQSTEMLRLNPQIGKVSLVSQPIVVKGIIIGTTYILGIQMEFSASHKEPLSEAQDILSSLRLAPPEMRTYVAFGQEQVPLDFEDAPRPTAPLTGQTELSPGMTAVVDIESGETTEIRPTSFLVSNPVSSFDDGDLVPDCDASLRWLQKPVLAHLGAFLRSQGYHAYEDGPGRPETWLLGTPDGVDVTLDVSVLEQEGMTWRRLLEHLETLTPEGQ